MDFPLYLIYLIYTSILALILVLVVPKAEIRRLAFSGILFGAIADVLIIILISLIFNLGGYKEFYPFGFMGIPFFPPLAWSIWFIFFFYLLPHKKPWIYIYVVAAASYCVIFSNVLQNLGIFQWNMGRIIVPYLLYLSWITLATWTYMSYFKDEELY